MNRTIRKCASKFTGILLSAALLAGMCVPAFAAEDYAISASFAQNTVNYSTEDQNVTLKVDLNQILSTTTYEFYFNVTNEAGETVSFPVMSGSNDNLVFTINEKGGRNYVLVTNGASDITTSTNTLGTFVMSVPAGTAAGTYTVNVKCNAGKLNETTFLPEDVFKNLTTSAALTVKADEENPDQGQKSDYTVSIADKTEGTAVVHAGDTITMDVVVKGGSYNAVYANVKYNASAFEYVSSSASDVTVNSSAAGQIKLTKQSSSDCADGSVVTTLTFKALGKITGEFDFGFASAVGQTFEQAKVDAVEANVSGDKVKIDPFKVTLGGEVAVTGETSAVNGIDYTASINDFDADNYTYKVTYTVGGVTKEATVNLEKGTFTIPGDDITGDVSVDAQQTIKNVSVSLYEDYVTGWTLVTVKYTGDGDKAPSYAYNGNMMCYADAYGASAWLVEGTVLESAVIDMITVGSGNAEKIAAGCDVNGSGKTDVSDASMAFGCYKVVSNYPVNDNIKYYLRSDVNADHKVDVSDVNAVLNACGL